MRYAHRIEAKHRQQHNLLAGKSGPHVRSARIPAKADRLLATPDGVAVVDPDQPAAVDPSRAADHPWRIPKPDIQRHRSARCLLQEIKNSEPASMGSLVEAVPQ